LPLHEVVLILQNARESPCFHGGIFVATAAGAPTCLQANVQAISNDFVARSYVQDVEDGVVSSRHIRRKMACNVL
jgi:hypothetical protein